MDNTLVSLDEMIQVARNHMRVLDFGVEEATESVLRQVQGSPAISLNVSLNRQDEIDEQIFRTFVSRSDMEGIQLDPSLDASSAPSLLRIAVPVMSNLRQVDLFCQMTEPQAESIMEVLGTSSSVNTLVVYLGESGHGVARPLGRFLRESESQRLLVMTWSCENRETESRSISEDSFQPICDGIRQSTSLATIIVDAPPLAADARDTVAQMLVDSAINSLSKPKLSVTSEQSFHVSIMNAFMNHASIRNFDSCFCAGINDVTFRCIFQVYDSKWKPVLSRNVPLGLWPHILAETKSFTSFHSHGPLDAIFFLLKEKNDVLLQNVRKRKIRKRKRYQISS